MGVVAALSAMALLAMPRVQEEQLDTIALVWKLKNKCHEEVCSPRTVHSKRHLWCLLLQKTLEI